MKKIIKWVSISVAGLLVLAVAFTAVFIVIPFARTMRNLSEKEKPICEDSVAYYNELIIRKGKDRSE